MQLPIQLRPGLLVPHQTPRTRVPLHVGATWDPEGILGAPSGGHIARRMKLRLQGSEKPSDSTTPVPSDPVLQSLPPSKSRGIQPITDAQQKAGGLLAGDVSQYDQAAFSQMLAEDYIPVDLQYPGLKIVHMDPPVFVVDNFLTNEQVDGIVEACSQPGVLQASKVGSGHVTGATGAAINERRTSESMLLTAQHLSESAVLKGAVSELHRRIRLLLKADDGDAWGSTGVLPTPGQYCFEALQVARYTQGQHFLAHEDAFPWKLALENRFQRHGTLLVYLNEVPTGGRTVFHMMDNLGIQPRKGQALLFFPAVADGSPDIRTLHTAEDAQDTKWITQQWIARGLRLPTRGLPSSPSSTTSTSAPLSSGTQILNKAVAAKLSTNRVPVSSGPPSTRDDSDVEALIATRKKKGKAGGKAKGKTDRQSSARGFG